MPSAFSVSARFSHARQRFEQPDGVGHPAGVREIAPKLRDEGGFGHARLQGPLQRVDRAGGIAPLPLDERQMPIGNRHVGTPRDHALIDPDRFVEPPRADRLDRVVYRLIQIDELLGIVRLGVARLGRRAARDVAERAQTGGHLRRLGAAVARRRSTERAQARGERTIALRRAARQIDVLARIGGQVVALGDGEINQLVAAGEHAGQRRPAAIEHRAHRLEVRRPWRRARAPLGGLQQRSSRKTGGQRLPHGLEHRRQDVHVPRGPPGRHPPRLLASRPPTCPTPPHQSRR
jgi:hypothetical protein